MIPDDAMSSYPFMQVDAFTDTPLGGNPCAIVFEADDLSAETMQALAREMNLSETAFVLKSEIADVAARYFTPAEEIPLAGHPTIATVFALAETGRIPLPGARTTIMLELKVGPIPVEIFYPEGVVHRVVMTQKKPQFLQTIPAPDALPVFGLSVSDLMRGVPVQVVSTGTPQLMIPVGSREALRRLRVDPVALAELREAAGFFSAHLFCLKDNSEGATTFARHFASPPDIFEDPFTGSATGGMGAYLWRYGLLHAPTFIAEQGHWMHRPGQARVEILGPRENIEAVKVGGGAVTVVSGELRL